MNDEGAAEPEGEDVEEGEDAEEGAGAEEGVGAGVAGGRGGALAQPERHTRRDAAVRLAAACVRHLLPA